MIARRPSRRARLLTTIAVATLIGAVPSAHAQLPLTTTRTFSARDLDLAAGESFAIQLHPNEVPIQLRATTRAALEVCPDGWPSFTGFLTCLPFAAGTATLPSTVVNTFHLGIVVRAVDGAAAKIKKLTVTYAPTDGYFLVDPPAVAPARTTATFSFTPTTTSTVGVAAYRIEDDPSFPAPHTRRRVTQGGRPLTPATSEPPGGRAPGYGPVRVGTPVKVRVTNTGNEPLALQLELSWD